MQTKSTNMIEYHNANGHQERLLGVEYDTYALTHSHATWQQKYQNAENGFLYLNQENIGWSSPESQVVTSPEFQAELSNSGESFRFPDQLHQLPQPSIYSLDSRRLKNDLMTDQIHHFTDYTESNSETWRAGLTSQIELLNPIGHQPSSNVMYHNHRIKTNRRKRERNSNINKAFEVLRSRIPNLPDDTKLSKIKILRLASRYIGHLNKLLSSEGDVQLPAFQDDIFIPPLTGDVENEYVDQQQHHIEEFQIDPLIVRVKRKRTDWGRIREEIQRHDDQNKSKRGKLSASEKSICNASANLMTY
uniref:uncharacterized protein LOC120330672 n=1 Tax=Styela clava TaxID=7725 RepID=UPI001939771B|nr:uncharacterized protein LOC120330672 [Styela clava]